MISKIKKIVRKKITSMYENHIDFFFKHKGFCPCCKHEVMFIARDHWLRDHFKCSNCGSIPRERALMLTIEQEYPNWRNLRIHESSPGARGHSVTLMNNVKNYLPSHFFCNKELGILVDGFRNEDLERQTFEDEAFDLVITSDVMEHIYDPEQAFKEIHRTLKKGGAHIFSVPLINKHSKTQIWSTKGIDGKPVFQGNPEYHGNPIDAEGSPVTMHWGYDIVNYIKEWTNDTCEIVYIDDLNFGIRAEFIEIIIQKKI
jgi:SAM-dependent methyltransferase